MRPLLALVCLLLAAPCWAQIAYNTPTSATYKPLDGATVSGKIHVQLQQTTGAPWTFSLDDVDKKPENTAPYVMANEAADSGDTNLWDTTTSADGKHVVTAKNATQTLMASFTITNAPAPSPPTNPTPTGSGATVVVSWKPPTTNVDGSVITDLAGFRIYFGMAPDALNASIPVTGAGATSGPVSPLSAGTWYFAVTAIEADGAESDKSAIVSRVIAGDTTPPPSTCPSQPVSDTQVVACPAGTTGTWTQTLSYSSVPYPQCWSAGMWTPAVPPAGACKQLWVTAKNGTQLTRPVYEAVLPATGTTLVRGNQEGVAKIGAPCGDEVFKSGTSSYRAIADDDAGLTSPTYRGRKHVAICVLQ